MVLLHLLSNLHADCGFLLSAVHVHHGLSLNADDWSAFCEEVCGLWGIGCETRRVSVAPGSGQGLEASARAARYAALAGLAADWIALGHHRDDQAETLLLSLLRGSGVRGASAMREIRCLDEAGSPRLLRPLLDVSREEILSYAQYHGLRWIEDESNQDRSLGRNFIRHEIVPRLRECFPQTDRSLARAAQHFAEAEALLGELAAMDLAPLRRGGRLDIEGLKRLSPSRCRNALRAWLAEEGVQLPDTRRLEECRRQLHALCPAGRFRIELGAASLFRSGSYLELVFPSSLTLPLETAWGGERQLPWGSGRVVFAPTVGGGVSQAMLAECAVSLRRRGGGERLQPDPRRPRRSIKNLFQELEVPAWRRPLLPFLWCGDRLAWVGGVGADVQFRCPAGEPGWLIEWREDQGRRESS